MNKRNQSWACLALMAAWALCPRPAAADDVTVYWVDTDAHIYDAHGHDGADDTWLFQIVLDISNDTDVAGMIADRAWAIGNEAGNPAAHGSGDDVTFDAQNANWTNFLGNPGVERTSGFEEGAYSAKRFYFRFFNASTTNGSEAGLIYNTQGNWVTPANSLADTYIADIGRGGTQAGELAGSTGSVALGWATLQGSNVWAEFGITNVAPRGAADVAVDVLAEPYFTYYVMAADERPDNPWHALMTNVNPPGPFSFTDATAVGSVTCRLYAAARVDGGSVVTNPAIYAAIVQPVSTGKWYKLSLPLDFGATNTLDSAFGANVSRGLSGVDDDLTCDLLYVQGTNAPWRQYNLYTSGWTTSGVATAEAVGVGQGFWIKRRSSGVDSNAIYTGRVRTNDVTVTFNANAWHLIAWPFATPRREDEGADKGWGFAAAGAVRSNSFNNADNLLIGTGSATKYYFLNTDGRWYEPGQTKPASNATLRAPEGYYYFHRGTGFVWTAREQ